MTCFRGRLSAPILCAFIFVFCSALFPSPVAASIRNGGERKIFPDISKSGGLVSTKNILVIYPASYSDEQSIILYFDYSLRVGCKNGEGFDWRSMGGDCSRQANNGRYYHIHQIRVVQNRPQVRPISDATAVFNFGNRLSENFYSEFYDWAQRVSAEIKVKRFALDNQSCPFFALYNFDVLVRGVSYIFKVGGVGFHKFRLSPKNDALKNTDYNQQSAKNPNAPIKPVSVSTYRHGDRFTDNYGMLCIICGLVLSLVIGCWGGSRIVRGLRRSGWCLIVVALLLDFSACASGAIGCLSWNWWHCLQDGQEHSHNEKLNHVSSPSWRVSASPAWASAGTYTPTLY